MKKIILTLGVFLLTVSIGIAQKTPPNIELKVNPIGAIFGTIPLSVEYVATDNIGIEASVGYAFSKSDDFAGVSKSSGLVMVGSFKYYFKPENGGDKFYAFPYFRMVNRKYTFDDGTTTGDVTATYKAIGIGFGLGYKWVADNGLLIDLGAGVGKNFTGEYTYDDPNYAETGDFTFPINGVFRLSLGYRF